MEITREHSQWAGRTLRAYMQDAPPVAPFAGAINPGVGWIGYFAYEAGLAIEPTLAALYATDPRSVEPLARFGLYDAAAVYDHACDQWYVCAVEWPRGSPIAAERATVKSRIAALRRRLLNAKESRRITAQGTPTATDFSRNMSYASYLEKVARAKRYIEAGDIYQVNLSQRFTVRTEQSPADIYTRLRRISPSSHAAFLQWTPLAGASTPMAVISCSPELFLDLRDGRVVTRPIKGTRPRIGDPVVDSAYRRELIESEKDRAELNMIVDLLRNDLGRICKYGSVRVLSADEIEEHPTVYHRVATIEGEVDARYGWLELLEATFPGGSITGAPKIRAMQIIDELEPTPRGAYCGAIGHIGLDGSMTMNVAIRTMVQTGNTVHIHAGGAIVADSRAEDEHDEVMAKASAMLQAVGCEEETSKHGNIETSKRRNVETSKRRNPVWLTADS